MHRIGTQHRCIVATGLTPLTYKFTTRSRYASKLSQFP